MQHIICDGTFLEHRTGIYAMMNANTRRLIYAAYDMPEGGHKLLVEYRRLASIGLSPISATVDGNPQQIKYLCLAWPSIKIQRCLVHIQRQGLSWCRRNPKRTDAKHLRKIFLRICAVKTIDEVRMIKKDIAAWEHRFGPAIAHSPDRGWVFSDLLRARSMILNSLPDLFHFVEHSHIPSSTNTLESYFSRLKEHYRHHRGLAVHHRDAYFKWYFFLIPGKKTNTKWPLCPEWRLDCHSDAEFQFVFQKQSRMVVHAKNHCTLNHIISLKICKNIYIIYFHLLETDSSSPDKARCFGMGLIVKKCCWKCCKLFFDIAILDVNSTET